MHTINLKAGSGTLYIVSYKHASSIGLRVVLTNDKSYTLYDLSFYKAQML